MLESCQANSRQKAIGDQQQSQVVARLNRAETLQHPTLHIRGHNMLITLVISTRNDRIVYSQG